MFEWRHFATSSLLSCHPFAFALRSRSVGFAVSMRAWPLVFWSSSVLPPAVDRTDLLIRDQSSPNGISGSHLFDDVFISNSNHFPKMSLYRHILPFSFGSTDNATNKRDARTRQRNTRMIVALNGRYGVMIFGFSDKSVHRSKTRKRLWFSSRKKGPRKPLPSSHSITETLGRLLIRILFDDYRTEYAHRC